MKRLPIILIFSAVLFSHVCCVQKEKPDSTVTPAITIGGVVDNNISVDAMFSQSVSLTIQSNCDWTAESDVDWVGIAPSSGKAGEFYEASVRVKQRNWSDDRRSGVITVNAGGYNTVISVSQSGYVPRDYGFDDTTNSEDGHPLLLADAGDFDAIRRTVVSTPWLKVIHDYVLRYAEKTLSLQPQEYKLEGIRLLNVSTEALKRLFYLSYAYRFTGDPRFAQRAETELLSLVAFPDWHPPHFLDVAEMMMGVSIAYDWCYPRLSASTKALVEDAIINKGIIPYLDIWEGGVYNWNQVCNGAALYAAICVERNNQALTTRVKDRVLGMIGSAMRGYSPDGAYIEGPGYWCYGTSYNVLLLDALHRRYGSTCGLLEAYPDFLKTTDYADAVITPSFRVFTYSDQAFSAQLSIVPFYVYDLTGNTRYLKMAGKMLGKGMLNFDHCRHERLIPAALVFAARRGVNSAIDGNGMNLSYIADGPTPVASFRENADDERASYMGIKLGMPSTSHGHMDIGTFCFEAQGVQWATDLGGENYNALENAGVDLWGTAQDSERWTVLRCALLGHNCISFDGKNQIVKASACFTEKQAEKKTVTADLSPLYEGQVSGYERSVSLDGKTGIVSDHIITGASVNMRWNMCTEASDIKITDTGAILSSADGHVLTMAVSGLTSFTVKTWDAIPQRTCETRNTQCFVGFESTLNANTEYKITVKLIPEK